MAYTGATLSMLNRNIEGGLREWLYISTDSLATVLGAGYFSDATNRGMLKGDIVWFVNQSTPTVYILQVSTVAAGTLVSPGAATVIGVAESSSSVSFFGATPVTTQPSGASQNAITDSSGGTVSDTIAAGSALQLVTVRLTAASLANSQEYQFDPGFNGSLMAIKARAVEAVTTNSKAATITGRVNAGALGGGGVISLSGLYAIGAAQAGTAITGAKAFTSAQTVGFTVGSVTAFVEGAFAIEMVLRNDDLNSAIAKFADMLNKDRTDLVALGLQKGSA